MMIVMFTFTPWFLQLAYLPDRRRENMADDDAVSTVSEHFKESRDGTTSLDEMTKDRKKNKARGMLGWLKSKVSYTLPRSFCCIKSYRWNY